MKLSIRRVMAALGAMTLALPGCGGDQLPPYSDNVKYGVRFDPVLKEPGAKLGDERYDPEPPGILPIMKFADIEKPEHPYYLKREEILRQDVLRDPAKIEAGKRKELEAELEAMFGTPAKPRVNAEKAKIDEATIKDLRLDDETLALGSRHYRIHCMHCHGVAGDGRGPTARWINPHPRDFRAGIYKFTSVDRIRGGLLPAARADLLRTLRTGLEGTAMPSFNILPDDALESLASYVTHLSMRGEVESAIIKSSFAPDRADGSLKWNVEDSVADEVAFFAEKVAKSWRKANDPEYAIKVAEYTIAADDLDALAASVQRGKELFDAKPSKEKAYLNRLKSLMVKEAKAEAEKAKREQAKEKDPKLTEKDLEAMQLSQSELDDLTRAAEKKAEAKAEATLKASNCVSCHTDYGRQARFRFDDWGTLARPNNFPVGNFRGGRRPVDMYYRIHSGIGGSGMNPFGDTLSSQDIWDLVNFVSNLSYPAMRERLGIRID